MSNSEDPRPACAGVDYELLAPGWGFNATKPDAPFAQEALALCRTCPLTGPKGACEKVVDPRASRYDGIAGGRIWRDGQPRFSHHVTGMQLREAWLEARRVGGSRDPLTLEYAREWDRRRRRREHLDLGTDVIHNAEGAA